MASACSNLNICLIQFVLCSNRTRLTLDWVRAFVIGDAARIQRKCRNNDRNRLQASFTMMLTSFGVTIAFHWKRSPHPQWEVMAVRSDLVNTPLIVQLLPEIRHRGCKGIMLNCVSLEQLASCW